MEMVSTYSVKIKHYSHIFTDTVRQYRKAVAFYQPVIDTEWEDINSISGDNAQRNWIEHLTVRTKNNPEPKYNFTDYLYKFPCYLRRAAIAEALGKISSYRSNLKNWEQADPAVRGERPSYSTESLDYPALYRDNMYVRKDDYTARIKVFIRNTWDWLTVSLKKSDVDYILHHCASRKACVPTLQKRWKEWYLDFAFTEELKLPEEKPVEQQKILAVDLGINNACTCSVMSHDGTILGRHFLRLTREQDCLDHAVNRIKKAQQQGNRRTPRLWNRARGINDDISVKTAQFIVETAAAAQVDTIVMEHLDVRGRKRGSKKQKLHLWRVSYVQDMVTAKAHRAGIRIRRVNAWGTSRLAFDGSGKVERGIYLTNGVEHKNYSICIFPTGKTYHCDLNAAYNIGARYFIREILKSLPATARFDAEAKVPQCTKRSTCTLSILISLHAVLAADAVSS